MAAGVADAQAEHADARAPAGTTRRQRRLVQHGGRERLRECERELPRRVLRADLPMQTRSIDGSSGGEGRLLVAETLR